MSSISEDCIISPTKLHMTRKKFPASRYIRLAKSPDVESKSFSSTVLKNRADPEDVYHEASSLMRWGDKRVERGAGLLKAWSRPAAFSPNLSS